MESNTVYWQADVYIKLDTKVTEFWESFVEKRFQSEPCICLTQQFMYYQNPIYNKSFQADEGC